jgi:hypothetical protein
MTFEIYEFTAYDPNAQEEFTFKGYKLPDGEVFVPEEQSNDCFYESLDMVEGHGFDEIRGVKLTGETVNFTEDELRDAIEGSAREFGETAIPATLLHWIN